MNHLVETIRNRVLTPIVAEVFKTIGLAMIGVLIVLCLLGCQRTLAPDGAYQGDKALYEAENALVTTHDLLQLFVTWEKDNRESLASIPEIRKLADRIVDEGPRWFTSANALIEAYKADPSDANKAKMQLSIDLIRAVVREASRYIAEAPISRPQSKRLPPPRWNMERRELSFAE